MNKAKLTKYKVPIIIGVGGLIGLYLLKHKKAAAVESESGPELTGSAANPNRGGEGGGGSGLTGLPGLIGEPGPIGVPGPAGVPAPELSPSQVAAGNAAAAAQNNPPTAASTQSPKPIAKANPFTLVNPVTHEHYRIENVKGKIIHVYHSGKRVVVAAQANRTAKAHSEAHQQAKAAGKATVSTPKASHAANPHVAGGGHVAPVAHGKPAPLIVSKPSVVHKLAPAPKPAANKPAKKR